MEHKDNKGSCSTGGMQQKGSCGTETKKPEQTGSCGSDAKKMEKTGSCGSGDKSKGSCH